MITICLIFTALAATALAKGFVECTFIDSIRNQHCYAAKGQQLIFHLSVAQHGEIRLIKDETYRILKVDKNGSVTLNEDYVNQFEQIQPGTFRLGNATKEHSGKYVLEEYRDDGKIMRRVQVNLKVQGSVSKPTVSQSCFPPEQKTVTCYSDEDDVEFFLALNGHSLIQGRDHRRSMNCNGETSAVSNICVNMHGQLTGSLMCSVWNNVSREDSVYQLTSCKGFDNAIIQTTVPVLAGSAVVLSVLWSFLYIKLHKRRRSMAPNEENAEGDVVYADVKVKDTRQSK